MRRFSAAKTFGAAVVAIALPLAASGPSSAQVLLTSVSSGGGYAADAACPSPTTRKCAIREYKRDRVEARREYKEAKREAESKEEKKEARAEYKDDLRKARQEFKRRLSQL